MGKKKFFKEVKENATVRVSLECSICGESTSSDGGSICIEDAEAELDEFKNELYNYGWRVFVSKEYGQIGLTCGNCIDNELNN